VPGAGARQTFSVGRTWSNPKRQTVRGAGDDRDRAGKPFYPLELVAQGEDLSQGDTSLSWAQLKTVQFRVRDMSMVKMSTTSSGPSFSWTVSQSAGAFKDSPVLASRLIEDILRRHSRDYLADAKVVGSRAWPADELGQPADAWLRELAGLFRSDLMIHGRHAIAGLSLLDPRTAKVAQDSGLLTGIAREINPSLTHCFNAEGLQLLEARAPLLAIELGVMPPLMTVPLPAGTQPVTVAVDNRPAGAPHQIGCWAVASEAAIFAGVGEDVRVKFETNDIVTLGFIGGEFLGFRSSMHPHRTRLNAVNVGDYDDTWPPAAAAAIGTTEIAMIAASTGEVLRGSLDQLPSAMPRPSALPTQITTRAGGVAVLHGTELLIAPPSSTTWREMPAVPRLDVPLASTHRYVFAPETEGYLARHEWTGDETTRIPTMGLNHVTLLGGSEELLVASDGHTMEILSEDGPISRWSPSDTAEEVKAIALSPDRAILAVATTSALRMWRIDTPADLRLTSYSADSPSGEDLLGVTPAVDALAALTIARAVTPPLSIGLFGAWGSGKSFFMNAMANRIDQLSGEMRRSQRSQEALWAWRNISQVRFNAWNYSSADVWAGMIEQLIRQLARPQRGDLELPPELDELQRQRLERLTEARDAKEDAVSAVTGAETKLNNAKDKLEIKRKELREAEEKARSATVDAARRLIKDESREALNSALLGAGLQPAANTLEGVWRELSAARWQAWSLVGLLQTKPRTLLIAVIAGPLAGLLVAGLLYFFAPQVGNVGATLAACLAFALPFIRWLARALDDMRGQVGRIGKAELEAQRLQTKVQQELQDAITAQEKAQRTYQEAVDSAGAASDQLAQATQRVESATPGSLLQEYLEGRNVSNDYRGQLGLIGTVRSDMEVLANAVEAHNRKLPNDDVVNRVVLYVDDLDRCRPEAVVKVLEAVHLLLSYPLFVVVVAVDAHWVSRSLSTVYPTLLSGGTFTPDQYLEKIFQLPVWLDSPTPDLARSMTRRLLTDGQPPVMAEWTETTAEPHLVDSPPAAIAEKDSHRPASSRLATTPPDTIVMEVDEQDAITELAPLLARSPRALKRYLNTYRLLKAFVPKKELPMARLLLAITTGRPQLGECLLDRIGNEDGESHLGQIIKSWSDEDQRWLNDLTSAHPEWLEVPTSDLTATATHVRRFVFRSST
jgi:hypothetical protein